MKILENLQQSTELRLERIQDYLDSLSVRERLMVVFAAAFVAVAAVGSALFYMHKAAEHQQKRLNDLKDTIVWMQSNAVTMKPAGDTVLSASDKVQRAAQQQGLSVASQQSGEQIQIAVMHENYAVLANFLTQLVQSGLSIEKMELSSEAGQIKLTAAVQ
ncbi:type II secretion system protein GspM [Acinetobacter pragensis]|uniref:type II secretion system protein GspM n=1 Tax=Acinetobacter pragensis TaxID=1806892 RepID=UPI003341601C